jgi:hypothetical protein
MAQYITKSAIKECIGVRERRLADLVADGVIQKGGRGEYLATSVFDFWTAKMGNKKPENHAAIKMEQDSLKNELLQIEIEKENGSLINADERLRDEAETARKVRDALFNIIPRCVPLLAAEGNPSKIQGILNTEIRHALDGLKKYLTDADD